MFMLHLKNTKDVYANILQCIASITCSNAQKINFDSKLEMVLKYFNYAKILIFNNYIEQLA